MWVDFITLLKDWPSAALGREGMGAAVMAWIAFAITVVPIGLLTVAVYTLYTI